MAGLLIRNLEPVEIARLKKRARRSGRSLQEEAVRILREGAGVDMDEARRLACSIQKRFRGRKFPDSARLIRADRER